MNQFFKLYKFLFEDEEIYIPNLDLKKYKNYTSRSLKFSPMKSKNQPYEVQNLDLRSQKNRLQEVKNLDPNKTNINKTEYNKTEYNNKSCALAQDKETVKFQIPLKDGSYYKLNDNDIEIYKGLYPNIDVEQEIKNIIGWNMANASKRKTKVGIKKHINTWR